MSHARLDSVSAQCPADHVPAGQAMFGAEEQFNLSIGVMSMYDTDGQLLREAWKASAQQQCPHANFALERSCGGILTGYSLCRT
jgi:hypothetical protein